MQLFDVVSQDFFKPLTGINRRKYVDIITLIWLRCKRSPLYGESKTLMLDTYSTSAERSYDVTMKPNFVECQGLRFQDFTVQRRG